jgi:solute carrier family 44 (choline transporter-like protein), member 2/4/5
MHFGLTYHPANDGPRGPIKNRSCTDVLCLLLFVAFLIGWGVVGYFGNDLWFLRERTVIHCARVERIDFLHFSTALGFTLGNPEKLIHPTDSDGRICGFHDAVKDKPFLFFFDLTKCANPIVLTTGCPTPQVSAHVKCRQPFPIAAVAYLSSANFDGSITNLI